MRRTVLSFLAISSASRPRDSRLRRGPQARTGRRASAFVLSILLALLVGGAAVVVPACEEEIDVTTEEGLKKALEKKEKLSEAMNELKGKASKLDELRPYGDALNKLFIDGSDHDMEVLQYLVNLSDPAFKDAYMKAVKSNDPAQVRLAAGAIGRLKLADAVEPLIAAYHATPDNEIRRVVLEVGGELKHEAFAKLAADLLAEKGPEDVPIANLRFACRVLATQQDPTTVPVLLRAMFYVDQAGRNIHEDCSSAILAIGTPAVPDLLQMLKLENEDVNRYVKRHEDILTMESVTLKAVTLLGKLKAADAKPIILARLADPDPIKPPQTLAVKDSQDKAWVEWAALIGQMTQELVFALNDVGVTGDEEAKKILLAMYRWEEPYPTKYAKATDYSNMIEISARVNAVRVMAENGLLDDATMQLVLAALKAKDFDDIKRLRPAARASLVTDMVTYLAIACQPGWTETVWKFFREMSGNELADDPKIKEKWGFEFNLEPARSRIARVESTFQLADECGDRAECYAKLVASTNPDDRFRKMKAIYELGRIGSHEHFELILNEFGNLDAFGYMYAAEALARLGNADDIPAVKTYVDKQAEIRASQTLKIIEGYLNPLQATLRGKNG